jgi:hypothetical protein
MRDIRSMLRMIAYVNESPLSNRKLLTKPELAPRYHVVPRTIDHWMKAGIIPYLKIGRKLVRFDPIECDRALEKFKVKAD